MLDKTIAWWEHRHPAGIIGVIPMVDYTRADNEVDDRPAKPTSSLPEINVDNLVRRQMIMRML